MVRVHTIIAELNIPVSVDLAPSSVICGHLCAHVARKLMWAHTHRYRYIFRTKYILYLKQKASLHGGACLYSGH